MKKPKLLGPVNPFLQRNQRHKRCFDVGAPEEPVLQREPGRAGMSAPAVPLQQGPSHSTQQLMLVLSRFIFEASLDTGSPCSSQSSPVLLFLTEGGRSSCVATAVPSHAEHHPHSGYQTHQLYVRQASTQGSAPRQVLSLLQVIQLVTAADRLLHRGLSWCCTCWPRPSAGSAPEDCPGATIFLALQGASHRSWGGPSSGWGRARPRGAVPPSSGAQVTPHTAAASLL